MATRDVFSEDELAQLRGFPEPSRAELIRLMALRDGLRSGDVHVPRSRRYADPASFLLTPQRWEPQRAEFCHLTGKPATAADALSLADDELHTALADSEIQLTRGGGKGEVRLGADGELVIPPLTAEDVPAEACYRRPGRRQAVLLPPSRTPSRPRSRSTGR